MDGLRGQHKEWETKEIGIKLSYWLTNTLSEVECVSEYEWADTETNMQLIVFNSMDIS